MTNKQACDFLGVLGCLVAFLSMGLMFFGVPAAVWGAVAGIALAFLALVNYD